MIYFFLLIKAEEAARVEEELNAEAEEQETEVENPWWKKYADKYQGSTSFEMGETTPPPEEHIPDEFPKAYNMNNSEAEPIIPEVPVQPEPEKSQEPELPTEPEPEPKCPFCYKDFSGKDELQEHMKDSHNVVIKPKPKVEKKIDTGTGKSKTGTKQTMTHPEPEISIPSSTTSPTHTPTTEEKSSKEFKPERINLKRPEPKPVPEPEPPTEPERVNLKRPDPEPVNSKPEPEPSEFQKLLTEKSKRSLSNLTEKLMGKSKVKKMKTKKAGNSKNTKSDTNPATNITVVQDIQNSTTSGQTGSTTNNDDHLDEEKENISNEKSRQINSNSNRKRPLEDREIEGQQFKIIFIISLFSFIFILFFLCCFLPFFGFLC